MTKEKAEKIIRIYNGVRLAMIVMFLTFLFGVLMQSGKKSEKRQGFLHTTEILKDKQLAHMALNAEQLGLNCTPFKA